MGFKKGWDVADVARQINIASYECSDPRNDGFTSFYTKQDLYNIKWLVEDALQRCPTFSGEDEWVREQDKKKVIKYLKNDI